MADKFKKADAVAQVYARSLFDLAESQGGLGDIETAHYELNEILDMMRGDRQFTEFMRSVVIPTSKKRESLRAIFGDGKISDLVLRFLLVLNDKERLGHLEEITLAYRDLYNEKIGRLEVVAYTPKPLDETEKERLSNLIREALGKEPVLDNEVEPEMIGGLKLRIGDRLIDASVSTRLAQLREQLKKSGSDAARARFTAMIEE